MTVLEHGNVIEKFHVTMITNFVMQYHTHVNFHYQGFIGSGVTTSGVGLFPPHL